ncbi:unnamed protein product [Aphanomyces euteiches]|uniref:Prenylcysteine lyase domain-containing protein n=1 Tax=Aphanomyces euteiches TaxID=100861 RepID=A0A6G0WT13_9STRA|nr:hypothetical protein Ae201684_011992 [Aphanomyces euteiches]KAH9056026.1 hypothetical protein Ae201684P_021766 [Aphanomyces euteiches]
MRLVLGAVLSLFALCAASNQQSVCIVGSGVGGSSTAFRLRQLLEQGGAKDTTEIHVFEQTGIVGGRVAVFDHHGQTIEAGGTVFLTNNRYMMEYADLLDLPLRKPGDLLAANPQMGIFNGEEILFETNANSWYTTLKLLWRYGPFSLNAFQRIVKHLVDQFNRIYDIQLKGHAFTDPVDLLHAIKLYDLTQTTLEQVLLKGGVSPKLINELLAGITRVNYGQNTTMTALAGAVGLAGSGDDLRTVVGGNFQVPKGLLHRARAEVHFNTTVKAVRSGFTVDTSKGEFTCTAVVIATPLELTDIALPVEVPKRPFQTTHTAFVEGVLNAAKFGAASASDLPGGILTIELESLVFSSMGLQYDRPGRPPLYKVFSRKPWTADLAQEWFVDGKIVRQFPWRAYPTYQAPEIIPKFELAPGLFYVNAIESAASAMEISAVGGRNVALLVKTFLSSQAAAPTKPDASSESAASKDEL